MEVERSMDGLRNNLQPHLPAKKRSISRLQCVSLYMCCCGEMQERQSMKEMMCEKAAEMQRKWLCSKWHRNVQQVDYESTPCLHLSVIHIKVHFSNGLFTKWALAVFISLSSLLCFKHLSLRQKWTLLLSLCLLPNTFHFHLHSLFICLCCPSLSSIFICFSGDKVTDRKIVTGTVRDCEAEIQIGYISFPLSPLHFFSERPSHKLQTNQVNHILATD